MSTSKLVWYFNRLRVMTPSEVAHRLWTAAKTFGERVFSGWVRVPPPIATTRFGRRWLAHWPDGSGSLVSAADRVLQGRWQVFSLDAANLGFPPDWNRDPLTGVRAPMRFGPSIDYRRERLVGNIKYLWEPSRHLELVTLGQAWRVTQDRRYTDAFKTLLDSWIDQCPYPKGVHWCSSLELGVRLANWVVAWHLFGGEDSPAFSGAEGRRFLERWLRSIYLHQRFIARHLSRHSSANNHLLGELMGLFLASLCWPCWRESPGWLTFSQAEFEEQALAQNWEDGVNKEQGIYYHHEVADMMLLCGLFARENGRDFSPSYWQRLEAMLAFIDVMMDAGGHTPAIGDADDALMVRFDPSPEFDPFKSLLNTGAALFARPGWRRGVADDLKTSWLLGKSANDATADAGSARVEGGVVPSPQQVLEASAFSKGGYWIMSYARGGPDEVHLVADAGPLGYLSIAAHGHADALGITLSLGGQPVLVDPGTFAYHTQRKWRDYFRGTSAHNTLCVDDADQSEAGGNFMWLRKAVARCLDFSHDDAKATWIAEQDGYGRLSDAVIHQRRIDFEPGSGLIRVTDSVKCKRHHSLGWHWHFDPECTIDFQVDEAVIAVPGWKVRMVVPQREGRFSLHRGQEHPPLGWVSRRFDVKEPAPTLRWSAECFGTETFVTEFRLERTGNVSQPNA